MKKLYLLPLVILLLTACTDVIDVEVPTSTPRLVVEASLDWQFETDGSNQTIQLSQSTPFFAEELFQPVSDAQVTVTNLQTEEEFIFSHTQNGQFVNNSFIPSLGNEYELSIVYDDITYTATEKLVEGTRFTDVRQSTEEGFDKEAIEVFVSFTDIEDQENYYLLKFLKLGDDYYEYFTISDEFFQGNTIDIFYERLENEDRNEQPLQPGEILEIEIYGISKPYYDYMTLLLEQSDSSGNPFAAIPATIKGNVINTLQPDQPAFGYFRLTQYDKLSYTIE